MALSNCRSNGQGLRLRYRLEVFGYAHDDLCASASPVTVGRRRRSLTVHVAVIAAARYWSSTDWTVNRLAVGAVLRLCSELCNVVTACSPTIVVLSLLTTAAAAVQT